MLCRWVEQDPKEILSSVYYCMEQTLHSFKDLKINPADIKGMFDKYFLCISMAISHLAMFWKLPDVVF